MIGLTVDRVYYEYIVYRIKLKFIAEIANIMSCVVSVLETVNITNLHSAELIICRYHEYYDIE